MTARVPEALEWGGCLTGTMLIGRPSRDNPLVRVTADAIVTRVLKMRADGATLQSIADALHELALFVTRRSAMGDVDGTLSLCGRCPTAWPNPREIGSRFLRIF